MSRIRSAILVQGVIRITMSANDDYLIVVGFSGLNRIVQASVDRYNRFLDRFVDPRMAYHITVGVAHYDEIEFLRIDSIHQLSFTSKALISGFKS